MLIDTPLTSCQNKITGVKTQKRFEVTVVTVFIQMGKKQTMVTFPAKLLLMNYSQRKTMQNVIQVNMWSLSDFAEIVYELVMYCM